MADSFKFELVSPERLLVSEEVTSVVIPGTEGEMTVMARHAPVMSAIRPGVVTVTAAAGGQQRYVVFGGFADILPESLTLLAESAVSVAEIDRADLSRRIQEAREDVADAKDDQSRARADERLAQLTVLEAALA
jgi:F-type H+-transporting ATPase subunit epsilon